MKFQLQQKTKEGRVLLIEQKQIVNECDPDDHSSFGFMSKLEEWKISIFEKHGEGDDKQMEWVLISERSDDFILIGEDRLAFEKLQIAITRLMCITDIINNKSIVDHYWRLQTIKKILNCDEDKIDEVRGEGL